MDIKESGNDEKTHIMTPEAFDQYKNSTIGKSNLRVATLYNWQSMNDLAARLGRQITPEDIDALVEIDDNVPEVLLACPVPECTHKMDAEAAGIIASKIDFRSEGTVDELEDAFVKDGNGVVERGRFVVRIRKDEKGDLIPEIQCTSCPNHRNVITMVPKREGGTKSLQERSFRQAMEHRDRLATDFAERNALKKKQNKGVALYQAQYGGGPRNNSGGNRPPGKRTTLVHSTDPAANRRAAALGQTGGKQWTKSDF